jgi:aminoglycoside phosphotransferase (APT) family kinase protein
MDLKLHKDEISIDTVLVRKLIDHEFPQFAGLTLSRLGASGSTNVQIRLGDHLLVRLPRQPGGSMTIDKEHHWTPAIGSHLPVTVPEFVGVGKPASGYSERWAIVRWLEGEHPEVWGPDDSPSEERSQLAVELAEVVLAMRAIEVPEEAMTNPLFSNYRGRSLREHDKTMRRNIERCRSIEDLDLDLDGVLAMWTNALELPGAAEAAPVQWYHGDLVAENLLQTDGRLASVLDFGGIGVGDPSIDLHGAWELLDPPAREAFRSTLGVDDAEWLRGRAWALAVAAMTFPYYWLTMPGRARARLAMARSVLTDADGH